MKTVFIETYGCQMNEYDSELVKSILDKNDYKIVPTLEEADIVLINTCSVRENANRKIYARVHEIKHAFPENPKKVGILGCMVTNVKDTLLKLPLDFMAGPDSYKKLPELVEKSYLTKEKLTDTKLSRTETYADITPTRKKGNNAWIAIMRGCNNFCSFCVVPYTRGRERSRTVDDIVLETQKLVDEGFHQVTLLGQNVNSYNDNKNDFATLLERVSEIDGIHRVRFTSPHPKDFPDNLIEQLADNPKICKQLHLPFQAGSDRILTLMRRTYTSQQYLELVDKIKTRIPEIVLSTDIIIGFPTETFEEYLETENIVKKVQFDSSFIFKYSEREGTLAAKKYPDDVPAEDKTKRIVQLNEIQKEISFQKNLAHIGQTHTVIVEKLGTKKSKTDIQSRNDGNKIVIFQSENIAVGDTVDIDIVDASPHVLRGKIISL